MKTTVASALAGLSLALCLLGSGSLAAEPCEVPSYLWFGSNELKHVAEAVKKDKRLTIAVVGTGSSILAGPDGPPSAYPARLEAALKKLLPSVAVKVVTLVRTRMTAEVPSRSAATKSAQSACQTKLTAPLRIETRAGRSGLCS